jgi:hypothetical protein
MPIPSGSHYTDRSRHFVQLPDGRTVTRAAAENLTAQAGGFRSNYERRQIFRQMKASPKYGKSVSEARRHGVSRQEADQLQARVMRDYREAGNRFTPGMKAPDSPLADWLRAIGVKQDFTTPVGESPGLN